MNLLIYFILCTLTCPVIAIWLAFKLRHIVKPQFPYRFAGLIATIILLIELVIALVIF